MESIKNYRIHKSVFDVVHPNLVELTTIVSNGIIYRDLDGYYLIQHIPAYGRGQYEVNRRHSLSLKELSVISRGTTCEIGGGPGCAYIDVVISPHLKLSWVGGSNDITFTYISNVTNVDYSFKGTLDEVDNIISKCSRRYQRVRDGNGVPPELFDEFYKII